ncbi:unnamed protein product [Phyllotreta striolata]|uniref:Uncharacterized protein n=1 Tax=Phyllotreta striolata TaxID=444603 RepID=A0A9N9TD44_PHYSR|nr:unnamed protein product [Phyllotreta striolata]
MFEFLVKMHLTHVILLSLIGCIYGLPNPEEYVVVRNSLQGASKRQDVSGMHESGDTRLMAINNMIPGAQMLQMVPSRTMYPMGQMGQMGQYSQMGQMGQMGPMGQMGQMGQMPGQMFPVGRLVGRSISTRQDKGIPIHAIPFMPNGFVAYG